MSFYASGKAFLVTFQSYIRLFRPSGAPSREKWAIWQQERTFLLPTSTSNGKAEQSHSSNVNSASFRRRQGAIPPATSGAEQGLREAYSRLRDRQPRGRWMLSVL